MPWRRRRSLANNVCCTPMTVDEHSTWLCREEPKDSPPPTIRPRQLIRALPLQSFYPLSPECWCPRSIFRFLPTMRQPKPHLSAFIPVSSFVSLASSWPRKRRNLGWECPSTSAGATQWVLTCGDRACWPTIRATPHFFALHWRGLHRSVPVAGTSSLPWELASVEQFCWPALEVGRGRNLASPASTRMPFMRRFWDISCLYSLALHSLLLV
mmetsp:Transcript_11367/g.32152  ORF Transcript_11367/g.32152 Transcript_11367/m.32152 type:complete len:212 (-) Transcript_11367:896-1531(-)